MARVIPFKGILYNPKFVGNMGKVIAPPYDVISEDLQDELYKTGEFNIVRLILGKKESGDTASNNRYTRARLYLYDWLKKDILKEDTKKAFYIYEQKYLYKAKQKRRIGFIALMKIEDPRTSDVLPHEYTFAGPKKDRLKLLSEVKANLSPIFSLFEDENDFVTAILKKEADKSDPLIDIDIEGINHRLWRLTAKPLIKKISSFLKSKPVFIADGHHRYEVALRFRNRMKKTKNFKPACDFTMVYFSNLNPEAVTILSTHRIIKDIGPISKKKMISKLKDFFEIEEFSKSNELFSHLEKNDRIRFGMYCGKDKFYLLTLRDEKEKTLSVTVLHRLIFNHILKIEEGVAKEENIIYTRDEEYAVRAVDKEGYKVAFFLTPTSIDQFKDIARSRARMPHKSTYFYPKLLSGLVINKF